jgi:DNA-binding response OmpR family regulator
MKKTILVAEDDLNISRLIQEIVKRKGYHAVVAKNGEDAFEQFKEKKFDLLITDLKMPKVDGIALIKMVRERDKVIPIVILTGYGSEKNRALAKSLGVSKILMKPCSVLDISNALDYTLKPEK